MSTNECKFCTAGRAHLDCPNGYAPTTLEELEKKLLAAHVCRFNDGSQRCECFLEALSHYRAGIAEMARELQSPETPNSFSEGWNAALDALADKLIDKS